MFLIHHVFVLFFQTARVIRLVIRAIPSQATSMLLSLHSILKSTASELAAPPDASAQEFTITVC